MKATLTAGLQLLATACAHAQTIRPHGGDCAAMSPASALFGRN